VDDPHRRQRADRRHRRHPRVVRRALPTINATDQGNVKRTRFAAVNFAGRIDPWKPSFDGKFWGPWDILVTGNQVYVGGDFLTVSGTAQQFLARFTDTP
jgi:hypothetical protein